jgi:ribosome-interacting GTPase 1
MTTSSQAGIVEGAADGRGRGRQVIAGRSDHLYAFSS